MIEEVGTDEGFDLNRGDLARVGTQAALGAVPLAKWLTPGRIGQSALKFGAITGAGETGRQLAAGEELDPAAIGIAGGLGAATGGILGKLTSPVTTPQPSFKVEPTVQEGGVVPRHGRKGVEPMIPPRAIPRSEEPKWTIPEELVTGEPKIGPYGGISEGPAPYRAGAREAEREARRIAEIAARKAEKEAIEAEKVAANQERLGLIEEAIETGQLRPGAPAISETIRATTPVGGVEQLRRIFKPPKKEAAVPKTPEGVLQEIIRRGTPQPAAGEEIERLSAITPSRALAPEAAPAGKAVFLGWQEVPNKEPMALYNVVEGPSLNSTVSARKLGELGIPVPETPPAPGRVSEAPLAVPEAPVTPETPGALAQLFKSPVDVFGEAYRGAKAEESINPLAKRYLGLGLQTEAQKAGLPIRAKGGTEALQKFLGRDISEDISKRIPGATPVPEVPSQAILGAPEAIPEGAPIPARSVGELAERWADEVSELQTMGLPPEKLDEASKLILQRLMDESPNIARGFSDETGAISPEILTQLMLGTGGAIGGSMLSDDPILGALAGAGAGVSLPYAIRGIAALGVNPERLGNIQEQMQTPEGIRGLARNIGRAIPHVQRFNYLASSAGLPANVFAGPYGSAVTGALTKALSGDPRGWAAIKELTPQNFFKEWITARAEAHDLIARTQATGGGIRHEGGAATEDIPGFLGRLIQAPAEGMTMGDVAARRILQNTGFTEDEARAFTLTSEPELPFFEKLANLRRGERSPMMETVLPFVRTPANIVEQGAHSTPGLGFITQSMRETPDALNEQIVQQALGGAAGVGGYLAGENLDPETARFLRRYITNLSGRYGLLSGLGFTAGQAAQSGQPLVSTPTMLALQRSFPLPTAEPITEAIQAVAGEGRIPRGALPFYDEAQAIGLIAPPQRTPSTLRPIAQRQTNRFRRTQ